MRYFVVTIILALVHTGIHICVTTADTEGLAKASTRANTTSFKKPKIGRKERCRHVVRKEVRKYSNYVRLLAEKLSQLEKDVELMRIGSRAKTLEMEAVKRNLTTQDRLLRETYEELDVLKKRVNDHNKPVGTGLHLPKDCDEVYKGGGMKYDGTYIMHIKPQQSQQSFEVLCQSANDAGWIVIQQRFDGSVKFNRKWDEYKTGFGQFQSEFWLGNEKIHQITSTQNYTLRVELEEFTGRNYWAEYAAFRIDNSTEMYRLHIDGYSGNAGDAMVEGRSSSLDGAPFSTVDMDNDDRLFDNCGKVYSAGWWYKKCHSSNINGRYHHEPEHYGFFVRDGVVWSTIHGYKSLKRTRMMLRPADIVR